MAELQAADSARVDCWAAPQSADSVPVDCSARGDSVALTADDSAARDCSIPGVAGLRHDWLEDYKAPLPVWQVRQRGL